MDIKKDGMITKEDRKNRKAKAKKKRLKKRRQDNSSEDEDESPFPAWKTGAVIAVIVACFAILYPKMFHPMLMFVLGLNRPEPEPEPKFPHPSMRAGPLPGNNDRESRMHPGAGPHPGMRMAAQGMGAQQGQGKSSKGMWHWMLPFYTIGVIVFLLYTLSKILWKSPGPKKHPRYGMRYNTRRDRFEVEGATESSEEDPSVEANDVTERGKLSNRELKGLQSRLNQTETAMQRILEQLETISGSVDQATADSVKKMTMDTLNNLARAEAEDLVDEAESLGRSDSKTARRRQGRGQDDPSEAPAGGAYLQDLEKALTDFKRFTDNYVAQHAQTRDDVVTEQNQKPSSAENRSNNAGENAEEEEEEMEEVSEEEEEEEQGEEIGESEEESDEEVSELSEEEGEGSEGREEGAPECERQSEDEIAKKQTGHPGNGSFDPMESEDPSDLSVPEPTGEIFSVGEGDSPPSSKGGKGVRKRARRT